MLLFLGLRQQCTHHIINNCSNFAQDLNLRVPCHGALVNKLILQAMASDVNSSVTLYPILAALCQSKILRKKKIRSWVQSNSFLASAEIHKNVKLLFFFSLNNTNPPPSPYLSNLSCYKFQTFSFVSLPYPTSMFLNC